MPAACCTIVMILLSAGAAAATGSQLQGEPEGARRCLWRACAHVQLPTNSNSSSNHRCSIMGARARSAEVRRFGALHLCPARAAAACTNMTSKLVPASQLGRALPCTAWRQPRCWPSKVTVPPMPQRRCTALYARPSQPLSVSICHHRRAMSGQLADVATACCACHQVLPAQRC
jgi:hypothetical protein